MKTIFIITTRKYPTKNSQFNSVISEYISPKDWDNLFSSTYEGDRTSYPIKKSEVGKFIFYVAPCMDANNMDDDYSYVRKLINHIKKDIKFDEYNLFLIAHDKDLDYERVRAHSRIDSNFPEFSRDIIDIDQHLYGFFSYQHSNGNNKKVIREDKDMPIDIEYDIYETFISFLTQENGIDDGKCETLKKILQTLDLGLDFDVTEKEVFVKASTSSLNITKETYNENEDASIQNPYQLVNYDELKNNVWFKRFVHKKIPVVTQLPNPLCDLEDRDIRYKNFLDSSIWFYAYDNDSDLSEINEQIKSNSNRYHLNKAREYREFYLRLLKEDFFDPKYTDHANWVVPFLFHSEKDLRKKIFDIDHQKVVKEIIKYKWRILLVDDNSDKERPMSIATEDHQELQSEIIANITKLDIVKEEFGKLFGDDRVTTDSSKINANIYIDCASSIEEAKSKLSRKKYEIILLDYLLGEKGGGREYGYELLRDIHDIECEIKKNPTKEREIKSEREFDYKKGPDNRFYFMFISAFTTAVSERLLTQGWLRSEDYWYIGEGACPVNTPYLFQYRLLHIMEKRMKDMGLSKILGINSNDFEKSYIKEKIIEVIYDDRTSIRQNANNRFNEVLSVLYNYKNLLVDTHNASNPFDSPESTLATALVMNNAYIGGFLEHLTQLVYLTAFGTVRQWPEMWEEYQFLKSVVGRIEVIEKYIFKLKNNNI